MLKLKDITVIKSMQELTNIPEGKVLINCINSHSYNVAQKDSLFAEALLKGGYLIPDGAFIVMAMRWLKAKSRPKERISGGDLFAFEMEKLNRRGGKCFFMGSSEQVLSLIRKNGARLYPNIQIETYSPPYKSDFSGEDSEAMISAINQADPDLIWIGMTAPKQEKWIYNNWGKLHIHCHVGTIGAVFEFFAGSERRAPLWFQKHSLEWVFRLIQNPKKMWKRSVIGFPLSLWYMLKEMVN